MKEKCVLSIALDDISRPFYVAGDVVSGYVRAAVISKISVAEMRVVLQCEERAAVTSPRRDATKSKPEAKRGKVYSQTKRHYISVQHPLHTEKGDPTVTLNPGEYIYPFSFLLPEEVNSLPPHAPVFESHGLYAGVWWTVAATVQRPRVGQSAFHSSAEVPAQPLPSSASIQATKHERVTAGGFTFVQEKPGFLDLIKGQRATANVFEAQMSYPMAGIPQQPHGPEIQLSCRSDQLTLQIESIEMTILQKCKTVVKGHEDVYVKEYPLGIAKVSQPIGSQTTDVSEFIKAFMLPTILVPSFSSQLVAITYELRLRIAFVPLLPNKKPKSRLLLIETPVSLQSPIVDWAQDQLQPIRPVDPHLYNVAFSDKASDYSRGFPGSTFSARGPESVGGQTALTAATGTGTASSYLSYEVQRPAHVVSNVMQWFGQTGRAD